MNGIRNENVIIEEYEFDKPLIQKIDSIIGNCIRGCDKKDFHTFDHMCVYDINLTNINNIEIFNLTISGKSMNLYELTKKIKNYTRKWFYI